ncbi:nuclear autoantigenic sperm protein isoform X3 [Amia ocellicauda]|uniref:nuclear autoantigenic sperm protein isoform X3 n=1 Tax=Amia ocellicauda TaxID=2972642 RepID=UPI0034639E5B
MPEDTPTASAAESAEEQPSASSSGAADSPSGDVMEEAKKLIGTGNRHMVMGDVVSAVNVFQEACGMLAKKYGDTADECAEAFFLCGKSLLDLARMENTVLGNALDGVPDEDTEEGEKADDSKIESADNLDDGEEEDEEDDDEGEGTAEDKESEEEEEVGNLQLAWEMLEVAKVIYKRKESKEDQLLAAQAHLKLGEVGAESGNYAQALEDFQECLALQLKHLPNHSRLLAETHYQLGLTFGYTTQYDRAIKHFSSSVEVIERRLAMLQESIDKAEGAESTAEKQKEMEELKPLLPDILEKIEDAKESQKTALVASEAIQQTLASASSGASSSSSAFTGENGGASASKIPVKPAEAASSSKSASDISHLVRKKRKPEEQSPLKDSDAKKPKQESAVNGSGESAGNRNGVEEKMEQEEPEKPTAPVESSA